jgi:hypothetical protein
MRLRPTHNDISGLILRDLSLTARVVSKNQVFGRLVNDRLAAAEALISGNAPSIRSASLRMTRMAR